MNPSNEGTLTWFPQSASTDRDSTFIMGSLHRKDSHGIAVNALFTLAGEAGNVTGAVESTSDYVVAPTAMEDSDNNSIASQKLTATASKISFVMIYFMLCVRI